MSSPVRVLVAIAVLVSAAPAQPAPAVCGGVNHLFTSGLSYTLTAPATLAVAFTPTFPIQAEGVEWFAGFSPSLFQPNVVPIAGVIEIRADDPVPGLPSESVLASVAYVTPPTTNTIPPSSTWYGGTFARGVTLLSGTTYWFTWSFPSIFGAPQFTPPAYLGVRDSPLGPDATPYTVRPVPGSPWSAVALDHRFMIRVLSTNCPPIAAVPARLEHFGSACGSATSQPPALFALGEPWIGSASFAMGVTFAAPSSPCYLFWTPNASQAAIPIGGGCELYLDPVALAASLQPGVNPIAIGGTDAGGTWTAPLPIPSLPSLTGQQIVTQAAAIDPTATPPFIPGIGVALTGAIRLTFGN